MPHQLGEILLGYIGSGINFRVLKTFPVDQLLKMLLKRIRVHILKCIFKRHIRACHSSIFARQGTSVQIIISPLYNQIRLNPNDLQCLKQLFGSDNVNDFSGPNLWNTDLHNYYEASHYRPHVAVAVMDSVY